MRRLRWLRRILYLIGAVAIVAGALTVVSGSHTIPGPGDPSASVESELRFYSVWWIGAGLFLWWLAPRVERRKRELHVFCALLFLAGVARLIAVLDTDWPSAGQIVLLGLELTLPVLLVALAKDPSDLG